MLKEEEESSQYNDDHNKSNDVHNKNETTKEDNNTNCEEQHILWGIAGWGDDGNNYTCLLLLVKQGVAGSIHLSELNCMNVFLSFPAADFAVQLLSGTCSNPGTFTVTISRLVLVYLCVCVHACVRA